MDELDAAELALAELTARVDRALACHRPDRERRCMGCDYQYPCPTVRALDPFAAAPSVRPLGGAIAAHSGG